MTDVKRIIFKRDLSIDFLLKLCYIIDKQEELFMSEKRLNNTIYIMYLVTENYKKTHALSSEQFYELDNKYHILNFVGECPDIFDSMNGQEMVEEIDQYVAAC